MTPPEEHVRIGSFAEAELFRLRVALQSSYAERLRDLEAMWNFNDALERRNPKLRRIAEKLREARNAHPSHHSDPPFPA